NRDQTHTRREGLVPPRRHTFPYTTLFRSNANDFVVIRNVWQSRAREASRRSTFEGYCCFASGAAMVLFSGALYEAQQTSRCFLRSEEHTSELQSQSNLVCRLLLEKRKEVR